MSQSHIGILKVWIGGTFHNFEHTFFLPEGSTDIELYRLLLLRCAEMCFFLIDRTAFFLGKRTFFFLENGKLYIQYRISIYFVGHQNKPARSWFPGATAVLYVLCIMPAVFPVKFLKLFLIKGFSADFGGRLAARNAPEVSAAPRCPFQTAPQLESQYFKPKANTVRIPTSGASRRSATIQHTPQ